MRIWIERHGRVTRWRNRQGRHPCGKRRKGRPAVGYGACHGGDGSPVRRARRAARLEARRLALADGAPR